MVIELRHGLATMVIWIAIVWSGNNYGNWIVVWVGQ